MSYHLDDVRLFVRVAELGTLSAAALERNVAVSHVSRALTRLEGACGVRLMHRSTHGLSLTDEGDTFLEHGRRLLELSEQLDGELSIKQAQPSGWVRVSVGASLGQAIIAPSLPQLYERHPNLHIDLTADDRLADLVRDGVDVAIRTGKVHGDSLVARRIGFGRRALYASPDYLRRHGTPVRPEDLAAHHLIGSSRVVGLNQWHRSDNGEVFSAEGQTRADNSALLLGLTLAGVGISRVVDHIARPFMASGQLVPLLQDYFDQEEFPIFAVMLQERQRLPKVRACVDFWAEILSAPQPAAAQGEVNR